MTDVERPVPVQETLEASPNGRTVKNKLSMVVFSGDVDKVTAALIMATGAAAAPRSWRPGCKPRSGPSARARSSSKPVIRSPSPRRSGGTLERDVLVEARHVGGDGRLR